MYLATAALALVGSAAVSSAATITFKPLDSIKRTIYFTGSSDIDPVTITGQEQVVQMPDSFQGNFYAVQENQQNTPGMLGEVAFGGWNNLVFFDVSAIVNPDDTNNVQQLYPAVSGSPMSGCTQWPCPHAYYQPDDVQTKGTSETDLICTLGGN